MGYLELVGFLPLCSPWDSWERAEAWLACAVPLTSSNSAEISVHSRPCRVLLFRTLNTFYGVSIFVTDLELGLRIQLASRALDPSVLQSPQDCTEMQCRLNSGQGAAQVAPGRFDFLVLT